jgi:serine protease
MSARVRSLCGLVAAVLVVGCRDSSPIPHTPTHMVIVSGANQSGDPAKALDSALVVRVLDGAQKPVAGVPLTWTVAGGGTVSTATTTTDAEGDAAVAWTLSPSTGVQAVTVTSAQIVGGSVSFIATNGATITGTITPAGGLPFGASFSKHTTSARFGAVTVAPPPMPRVTRIIVGLRSDALGVASLGAGANRSISVARQTVGRMQQTIAVLAQARGLSHVELSPALLAARVEVDDPTQIDAVMAALRSDANVSYVERDEIISIRDGAPRAMSADLFSRGMIGATAGLSSAGIKLPNDPGFWEQLWPASMIDLPKAWAITTGSASVTVAVVDMGIRFDHTDIAANLTNDGYDFVKPNPFTAVQKNCDGTTFTSAEFDATPGPDADPTDPDDLEFDSGVGCWFHNSLGDHGLWTAGIIGAVSNEGAGTAGVNWNVRIRPIRVLDVTGSGTTFDIAQGVLYAAGLPAPGANSALVQAPTRSQIINMSLGGSGRSTTLENAVNAAFNAGSLVVASAGNDGLDIATYPAAYMNVMGIAAVGQDGALATYSNGGTFVSVAAPGGDFRFDDNGGGAILGPAWDFTTNKPTFVLGYGTSASAPYVSGIAALLLAQTPSLTATQLRQRIEQFATRPAGVTRSDAFGWGIVNAYNALTQTNGAARQTIVRLVDATTGLAARTVTAASGSFAFARLPQGSYYVQAGDDESGDALIGLPGRRYGWAGGFGTPTVFNVNGNAQSTAIVLGVPTEVEPNDDVAHANLLGVGGYVVGNITTPDVRDVYSVTIPVAGAYAFETSGLLGSCGLGIELDTFLSVADAAGVVAGSNNDFTSVTSRFCSKVSATLAPGVYYVTVTGSSANRLSSRGRYRLEVRSGP